MARRDYGKRLAAHIADADLDIKRDCDAMLAEHSAAGRLRSGATLSRAAKIWIDRTGEAVERAQAEFATIIDRRGREWQRAMAAVLSSLDQRRSMAKAILAGTFRAAAPRGGENGGAMRSIDTMLDRGLDSISERAEAFRDGWTSPVPRKWNERHPVLFAVSMLALGAVLSEVGHAIVAAINAPTPLLPSSPAAPRARTARSS